MSNISIITTIARATLKNITPTQELLYAKELLKYDVIVTDEDIQWAKKNAKVKLYELLVQYTTQMEIQ